MNIIDKMDTLASLNLQLSKHEESRRTVSAALLRANEGLVTAKVGQRGRIRDSIKNFEQELKRLDRLIQDTSNTIQKLQKSDDKLETKTTAYEQGFDPNAAWADAVKSGLGSVSNAFVAASGAGLLGKGQTKSGTEPTTPPETPPAEPPFPKASKFDGLPMYIAIVAVVLYFIMKKK
jgi:hypothetical protein